jgi:hypothetical protein
VIHQDSSDPEGVSGPNVEGTSMTSRTAARNRKADAAVALKLAGATWGEIAQIVGYPTARQALVSVARARELIDRHAKLYGLDAPTEFVVHNPTQAEIERWVATMLVGSLPAAAEYDIITGEVVDDAVQAG